MSACTQNNQNTRLWLQQLVYNLKEVGIQVKLKQEI